MRYNPDFHPIAPVLAESPLFARIEPIEDVAAPSKPDLYIQLARTIEREVVPRLLLSTRLELARRDALRALTASEKSTTVVEFCRLILTEDLGQAKQYVKDHLAHGATPEGLLLELFAPAARRLGDLWDSDECTFLDVTIALGKLQLLLRLESESYRTKPDPRKLGFRALLSAVPSNEHTFGVMIVEKLFLRAGWNVLSLHSPSLTELKDAVRAEWFAVVGLSIGCDESAPTIASLIKDIRAHSLNQSVLVLLGGRYINDHPDQAAVFGADLAGASVQEAIVRSEEVLRNITLPSLS